jgi:anhydro-N-acetylmuramic acid kinase
VNEAVLAELLRHPFFSQPPPKSAGREQFGRYFVESYFLSRRRARFEDMLRTSLELTARTIVDALARFVFQETQIDRLIVSGGAAHNRTLLKRLAELNSPAGTACRWTPKRPSPSPSLPTAPCTACPATCLV